jgi:hypothetical protein
MVLKILNKLKLFLVDHPLDTLQEFLLGASNHHHHLFINPYMVLQPMDIVKVYT